MSFAPYPEYKDSGVEWLGEVRICGPSLPFIAAGSAIFSLKHEEVGMVVRFLTLGMLVFSIMVSTTVGADDDPGHCYNEDTEPVPAFRAPPLAEAVDRPDLRFPEQHEPGLKPSHASLAEAPRIPTPTAATLRAQQRYLIALDALMDRLEADDPRRPERAAALKARHMGVR